MAISVHLDCSAVAYIIQKAHGAVSCSRNLIIVDINLTYYLFMWYIGLKRVVDLWHCCICLCLIYFCVVLMYSVHIWCGVPVCGVICVHIYLWQICVVYFYAVQYWCVCTWCNILIQGGVCGVCGVAYCCAQGVAYCCALHIWYSVCTHDVAYRSGVYRWCVCTYYVVYRCGVSVWCVHTWCSIWSGVSVVCVHIWSRSAAAVS